MSLLNTLLSLNHPLNIMGLQVTMLNITHQLTMKIHIILLHQIFIMIHIALILPTHQITIIKIHIISIQNHLYTTYHIQNICIHIINQHMTILTTHLKVNHQFMVTIIILNIFQFLIQQSVTCQPKTKATCLLDFIPSIMVLEFHPNTHPYL